MTTSKQSLETAGAFVIIGGAGGLGRSIAEALAADGARLLLAGRALDRIDPASDWVTGQVISADGGMSALRR